MRILLIGYAFPPIDTPQTISTIKAVRSLAKLGHEITVLTARPPRGEAQSAELMDLVPSSINVVRTPVFYNATVARMIQRTLPFLLYMPDSRVGWYMSALSAARKLVRQISPEIIYSRSQPFTSHLIARKLARETGIRWLAYFSDPLYDNVYYYQFPINPHRRINRRIEKSIFMRADEVHFVSEETLKLAAKRYVPEVAKKFVAIPHCYDASLYPEVENTTNPPLTVSYIGEFQSVRNPHFFLDCIATVRDDITDLSERLKIRFVGRIRKSDLERIRALDLDDIIELLPRVSYIESLRLMRESDVLVLIDGAFTEGNVFFPSKLADYLGSERPIIGVTPSNSASARIMRELGYPTVEPWDESGLVSMIKSLLVGPLKVTSSHGQYDSNVVAEQISKRLSILARGREFPEGERERLAN